MEQERYLGKVEKEEVSSLSITEPYSIHMCMRHQGGWMCLSRPVTCRLPTSLQQNADA